MKKVLFSAMLAVAIAASGFAGAQDAAKEGAAKPAGAADAKAEAGAKAEAPKATEVVVTGENYALAEALGEEAAPEGLALNALKVTEAKGADGKAIANLKGKTLHYLPTKGSAELVTGDANKGKSVTVTGKLYADAGVLVVDKFEAAAGDDGWEELPAISLSGQPVL